MEKKYESPEAEVVAFELEDILTMSPGGEGKKDEVNW